MESAIKIINEIQKAGLIKAYAIGGGIALTYYVEPILTFDLDIFFIPAKERLDMLSPIYEYLKNKGYKPQKEMIIIEGIPVQFIPVYNELVKEAVEKASQSKYRRVKTRILKVEHLLAIALQADRPKDRERVIKILDEARIDKNYLERILKKFDLYDKFLNFKSRYYER